MSASLSPTLDYFSYYISNVNEHSKHSLRFLLILAGHCNLLCKGGVHKLKTGSLVLIENNLSYQIQTHSGDFYCNVLDIGYCSSHTNCVYFADLAQTYQNIQILVQNNPKLTYLTDRLSTHQRMIELLQIYMTSKTLNKSLLISYTLYTILKNIEQNLVESNKHLPYNRHISQSLRYIHNHYTESISAYDIAKELNLHVNYFHNIFFKYMGTTFLTYITTLRMNHAKELLASTTLSIDEISKRCSIENTKYFFRIFKKHVGSSPNEYRKNYNLTPLLGNGQYIITNKDSEKLIGVRGEL